MEIKVETGVPLPASGGKGYAKILRALKVMQSVVLPCDASHANGIAQYALGKGKFAVRTVDSKSSRVWRLK